VAAGLRPVLLWELTKLTRPIDGLQGRRGGKKGKGLKKREGRGREVKRRRRPQSCNYSATYAKM